MARLASLWDSRTYTVDRSTYLKKVSHEIFDFWFFFHEILSPANEQWVSHRGRYEFFAKIHVDNFNTGEKLPPVSLTPMTNICIRISPRIFVKRRNGSNRLYLGAWGKLTLWKKNLKLKISCKTSFKNLWDCRRTGTDFSPHYLKSPLESRRYICGSCRE
jgi:hypothetical protein